MTTKEQLRVMADNIRVMMTDLNEISEEGLEAQDEANINALYEQMRDLRLKLGETARTFKGGAA